GPVFRAEVAQAERRAVPHDGGVARGHIEIALGVEANVRQRMASEPDVGLVEGRDLPGARARQEPELGGHWLRVARRSEEHTSELQSRENLVCRLLLEKKKKKIERKIEQKITINYSYTNICIT